MYTWAKALEHTATDFREVTYQASDSVLSMHPGPRILRTEDEERTPADQHERNMLGSKRRGDIAMFCQVNPSRKSC